MHISEDCRNVLKTYFKKDFNNFDFYKQYMRICTSLPFQQYYHVLVHDNLIGKRFIIAVLI